MIYISVNLLLTASESLIFYINNRIILQCFLFFIFYFFYFSFYETKKYHHKGFSNINEMLTEKILTIVEKYQYTESK